MDRRKVIACLTTAVFGGCSKRRRVVAGSKNFTEQVILGEIVAQHLQRRLKESVQRKLNLGGTLLAQQALVHGEIDLYPEYTGTALSAVLKLPSLSDPAEVLARVRAEYRSRWNLEWLDPLGFNNTFVMVVRSEEAYKGRYQTLSDAARRSSGWTLGAGYEFERRPDGLAGLLKTYHLPLKGQPHIMDLGLLYKALQQKQVDMVAGNATDGLLSVLQVKILRDDKHYFPPYQAALVVRSQALAGHAGMRAALEQLSGKFSDEMMRKLNYEVDGKHRPVSEVAAEALMNLH